MWTAGGRLDVARADTFIEFAKERLRAGAERVIVGLPLTLRGEEGAQAERARTFAERLARRVSVPVELHDERLTTRLAERTGGNADADSRAAAHLLESYLAVSPE